MRLAQNIALDSAGIVIALVIFILDRWQEERSLKGNTLFTRMLCCALGVLLFDIPAWLLDGVVFPGSRELCFALDTFYYALQSVYCYLWLLFSFEWSFPSSKLSAAAKAAFAIPLAVELALLAANIWTGVVFAVSTENIYSRGTMLNLIPFFVYIACAIGFAAASAIKAEDLYSRRRGISLIVFMFLPVCATLLQSFFYGFSILWPFVMLSLLITYLYMQQSKLLEQKLLAAEKNEAASKLESDLSKSRVAIMLSQIQPHFLFNVLSAICYLCDTEPQTAKKATVEFADYLRGNLDSLSVTTPIPFDTELKHTELYLSLEKLRFEDDLIIIYELDTTDFTIPALTLQPLVENAVRHGTGKTGRGGMIVIATREYGDRFELSVSDDGPGFDPLEAKPGEKAGIGISNVKNRLWTIRHATLQIISSPGCCTRALISIPKEQN